MNNHKNQNKKTDEKIFQIFSFIKMEKIFFSLYNKFLFISLEIETSIILKYFMHSEF